MKSEFLALTLGDPCGVGPELVAKVIPLIPEDWRQRLVIVGPIATLQSAFEKMGQPAPLLTPFLEEDKRGTVKFVDVAEPGPFPPGKICAEGGKAALKSIETAHGFCFSGSCLGMITAPIGKMALRLAGSKYSGHTDMLCGLTGVGQTRMAMIYKSFRVVMTTLHVSYREALEQLTIESVLDTISLAHETFASRQKPMPAIAVAGINPHAGEGGLFGTEEENIITPAIQQFSARNRKVAGPFPADSMFKREMRRKFDVFIAHTHDHGLIAIKTLGGIQCVNVTLGLPYIRTSVGHGTAYDIAGTGRVNPNGMREAIREAFRLADSKIPPKPPAV